LHTVGAATARLRRSWLSDSTQPGRGGLSFSAGRRGSCRSPRPCLHNCKELRRQEIPERRAAFKLTRLQPGRLLTFRSVVERVSPLPSGLPRWSIRAVVDPWR
jgi:hypothetical protein